MKVWAVGAGAWGKNIVRTLHSLEALGGIIESDKSRHETLSREYPGIPLLDRLDLPSLGEGALAFATPVPTHFTLAKAALEAGRDVFVEKPLTLSASEAEILTRLAETKGRVLMVGHLLLYQPAIRWIRSFLQEGGLGKLISLHQERLNFGRARAVENALWSLGVHDVAVLLHLVGSKPNQVSVTGKAALTPGVEDDVYLHLTFPDDVEAHLHVSWMWPEKRRRLTLVGEKGMLVFDELTQKVTLHRKHITPNLQQVDEGSEVVFEGDEEPLKAELGQFIQCLSDRSRPVADGSSGTEVVRVLETATRLLEAER